MKSIAIITARGGSKRIPKKNIKNFCGKPIISYGIEAAIQSGIFDEVMVSTDSKEIAEIAVQFGASIPFFRSEKTSNDYATTNDVLFEVLDKYKGNGFIFDSICCIYPTAPFVTPEKLIKAYEMLQHEDVDAVIPVVRFSYPPQRAYIINNRFLQFQFPEFSLARSQDLEPIYHDSGQFYFYKTKSFYEKKELLCKHTLPLVLDETEVQDIDTIEDWNIAEIKYERMQNKM